MSIDDLSVLIGTWELTGRSAGADSDDISGTLTAAPILGGTVLQLTGTIRTGDTTVDSLEVIWPDGDGFAAHVYPPGGPPVPYRWARTGPATLTHSGPGATYHGTVSDDGATVTGAWRPEPGGSGTAHADHTVVMRRVC
jgi:hypothetical protein